MPVRHVHSAFCLKFQASFSLQYKMQQMIRPCLKLPHMSFFTFLDTAVVHLHNRQFPLCPIQKNIFTSKHELTSPVKRSLISQHFHIFPVHVSGTTADNHNIPKQTGNCNRHPANMSFFPSKNGGIIADICVGYDVSKDSFQRPGYIISGYFAISPTERTR